MKNKTKIIAFAIAVAMGCTLLTACSTQPKEYKQAELVCNINGEDYTFSITYDENYKVIEKTDDIKWFNENIDAQQYKDDALGLIAYIETTVRGVGGTVNHYPIKTITSIEK